MTDGLGRSRLRPARTGPTTRHATTSRHPVRPARRHRQRAALAWKLEFEGGTDPPEAGDVLEFAGRLAVASRLAAPAAVRQSVVHGGR